MEVPAWKLPLDRPPTISLTGIGWHGRTPKSAKYCLSDAWCIHLYKYHGTLAIDRNPYRLEPGMVSVIPALVPFEHRWDRYPSVHIYVWFSPATRVADGPNTFEYVPALQHLGQNWEVYAGWLEDAVMQPGATQSSRTQASLWDLLWRLARKTPHGTEFQLHPGVRHATALIQSHMDQALNAADLAEAAQLSPSQLRRLFQQAYAMTPMAYLRHCRIERARKLLVGSSHSIKGIAALVGIHDLQFFNKMIHRELGAGPRQIRRQSQSPPPANQT